MKAAKDLEIIYVADPMCSWCWGFAPVMDEIIGEFGELAQVRLIMGGLRPGPAAQKMDEATRTSIRSHWQHVADTTGQPFDFAFFEREDFLYDTEPAARAVVAVRAIEPQKEYLFLKSLQSAFYAENQDISNPANYPRLLREHAIAAETFLPVFADSETGKATQQDFYAAQELGIRGFPSLVLRNGERLALLSRGYQPYESLITPMKKFLNGG